MAGKTILAIALASAAAVGLGVGGYFVVQSRVGNEADNDESVRPITPSSQTPASETPTSIDSSLPPSPSETHFLSIPGGTFTMGSPETEAYRDKDEVQHTVTIDPFYVDAYEVFQSDFEALMGSNPSHFDGESLPVENVTWYEAIEFCNRKSEQAGLDKVYTIEGEKVTYDRSANGYRLLTEAEWEYVARAGTTTTFHTGAFMHTDYANYYGSYPYMVEEHYSMGTIPDGVTRSEYYGRYRGTTVRVDDLPANQFGLYNILGNVSEWVFDDYGAYDVDNADNPVLIGGSDYKVNRGGSYNDFCKHLRAAYRSATNPRSREWNLGFRIARNAEPKEGSFVSEPSLDIDLPSNPRTLIAYFSHSGNTERGANILKGLTGGDIFEISRAEGGYSPVYPESAAELKSWSIPELSAHVENIDQYDLILLGYPTWWGTTPMPIVSFLSEYDFSGKTILTFSSHGGTRLGDSVSQVAKLALKSYVGTPTEWTYGSSSESLFTSWLADNGVTYS